MLLIFGDHDISDNDTVREQRVSANAIFIHPQYEYGIQFYLLRDRNQYSCFSHVHCSEFNNGYLNGYDIAMLHLFPAVSITTWVKPICLPRFSPEPGTVLVVTGWGASSVYKHYLFNTVLQTEVKVLEQFA